MIPDDTETARVCFLEICRRADVSIERVRNQKLTSQEFESLFRAAGEMSES